ncbi:MAG: 7TM diverse intracellular signaling domain-containing protein [Oligoflexus sp.]
MGKLLLVIIIVLSTSMKAQASDVVLQSDQLKLDLNPYLDIFIDREDILHFETILDPNFKGWQRNNSKIPNFGLTLNPIWIKLTINNSLDQTVNRILEIQHSLINTIDLYYHVGDQLVHVESGRSMMPNAAASALGFTFELELKKHEQRTLFFRIKSSDGLQTPMMLWEPKAFLQADHKILAIQSLYYGVLLMMIIYNLYLAYRIRNLSYLYYVVFAVSCGAGFFFVQGFHCRLLWRGHDGLTEFLSLMSYQMICVGALLFSSEFLQLRKNPPKLKPWLQFVWGLLALSFLGILFLPYFYALQALQPAFLATSAIIFYAAIKLTLSANRIAKPFLIAWCFPIIGIIVTILSLLGLIQPLIHPVFPAQVGSVAELMLLSLALAERLNELQRSKIKIQHKLEVAIKSHNEAQRLQQKLLQPQPLAWWIGTSFHYEPAAFTSGDWFGGFYDKWNDRVFYFMGDVTGHGLSSGIVTAAIAGSIYLLSESKLIATLSSEEAIDLFAHETNKVVRHVSKKTDHMMSMVFLVFDYQNKICHYLNAGHPAIFVITKQKVNTVLKPGSLLGMSETPKFGKSQIKWEKDQIFFLYTDGLIENQGPDQKMLKLRDLSRLLHSCQTTDNTIALISDTTQSLWKGYEQEDDLAMVALQLKAG